jgi:hypothetical protein
VRQNLPDRPGLRDEGDQPDVAATRWALVRKLLPHPGHQLRPRNPGGVVRPRLLMCVAAAAFRGLSAGRMPASHGTARLADVPYCQVSEIVLAMREHAQTGVTPEVFAVKALAEECLLLVRNRVEDIEVVLDVSDNEQVTLRRAQFGQVLINLIVNAADELHSRGRLGNESFRREPKRILIAFRTQGERFGFWVEDTGRGFELDTLEHADAPFYSTKGNDSNTGLGLAIVRHIVDIHNSKWYSAGQKRSVVHVW